MKTDRLSSRLTRLTPAKGLYYLLILLFFVGCNQPQANGENKGTTPNTITTEAVNNAGNKGSDAITVVNWNIEWLGSPTQGPKNKEQQLQNAIKIMGYLKADIYCLCEIVNPAALKKLTSSLGGNYAYALSDYASGASSTRDAGYANSQKLAFIYNKQIFKNIKTSGYLKQNPKTGYYFAAGRYPFELQTTVHTPDLDQKVDFLIIHAKSGADLSSYDRRLQGATILKAALDKDKSEQPFILLGDFNDHVIGSITKGKTSPYDCFMQDPNYYVLTQDLSNLRSTLDYPGVIDQQIISKELNKFYKAASVKIRTDITSVVPDFKNGHTSDHYPVSSIFVFSKALAEAPPLQATASKAVAITTTKSGAAAGEDIDAPQRLQQRIFTASVTTGGILVRAAAKSRNIQFILYNKRQHKVLSVHRKYILKGDSFRIRTPKLYKGDYNLVIFSDHGKQVLPFSVK